MNANSREVTIVMIEDDEGHARLIEKNIRRAGVNNEIVPFTYGNKALDFILGPDRSGAASKERFLLVLLDLNLPDMSGIHILEQIKANEHTKRLPVIVLTTTDDEREFKSAMIWVPTSILPSLSTTTDLQPPSAIWASFSRSSKYHEQSFPRAHSLCR